MGRRCCAWTPIRLQAVAGAPKIGLIEPLPTTCRGQRSENRPREMRSALCALLLALVACSASVLPVEHSLDGGQSWSKAGDLTLALAVRVTAQLAS